MNTEHDEPSRCDDLTGKPDCDCEICREVSEMAREREAKESYDDTFARGVAGVIALVIIISAAALIILLR